MQGVWGMSTATGSARARYQEPDRGVVRFSLPTTPKRNRQLPTQTFQRDSGKPSGRYQVPINPVSRVWHLHSGSFPPSRQKSQKKRDAELGSSCFSHFCGHGSQHAAGAPRGRLVETRIRSPPHVTLICWSFPSHSRICWHSFLPARLLAVGPTTDAGPGHWRRPQPGGRHGG